MLIAPLRDDVYAAKQKLKRSEFALHVTRQLRLITLNLDILEQRSMTALVDEALPGTELIEQAIVALPELAGLRDIPLRPSASVTEKIQHRRLQLQTLAQVTAPLAAQEHRLRHEIHALLHRQHDLLMTAENTEVQRFVADNRQQVVALKEELAPLEVQCKSLAPTLAIIENTLPVAEAECLDPEPNVQQRGAARLRAMLTTTETVCRAANLPIRLPPTWSSTAPPSEPEALLTIARTFATACRLAIETAEQAQDQLKAQLRAAEDKLEACCG